MLIAGAGGHAKEILQIILQSNYGDEILFFHDQPTNEKTLIFKKYKILKNLNEAELYFKNKSDFVLGVGSPIQRNTLYKKLSEKGGVLVSIISAYSNIGSHDVNLSEGLNVMHASMISNSVTIGRGSLINAFASIHHDVTVGSFCEVSPHATLLGGCKIGDFTSVGANATILPNILVGKNVIIGAGSVVNKNLPDNSVAVGVPAKIIKVK